MKMNKLQKDIIYLIQCQKTTHSICYELNISMEELLLNLRYISECGIPINVENGEILTFKFPERVKSTYNIPITKDHIKIGFLGDTHLASIYDNVDSLKRAYDVAEEKNVDVMFHSGDLVDGIVSVPDYIDTLREATYTGQIDYVLDKYPKYSGKTFVVSGNHEDYWTMLTGKEIIKDISDKRDDIVYLGASRRVVTINGLKVNVLHGRFKSSSVINNIYSYIDNMDEERKPDIMHAGHYHTSKYTNYNGVEIFRNGSFMEKTPRDIERGLTQDNSMYFADVYFDDNGEVDKIMHEKKTFGKRR